MSYIQTNLSQVGVTGITGGFTGTASSTYGFNGIRVSWQADQDSIVNVRQGPDITTSMFLNTYIGVSGSSYTQTVPVKASVVNVDINFAAPPSELILQTFFFKSPIIETNNGGIITYTQQVSGATASIEFSGLTGGTNLLVSGLVSNNSAGFADIYINFNGDTGMNYIWTELYQTGAIVSGANSGGPVSGIRMATIGSGTGTYSGFSCTIPNYTSNVIKAITSTGYAYPNDTGNQYNFQYGGKWNSTSAITDIVFTLDTGLIVDKSIFNIQII